VNKSAVRKLRDSVRARYLKVDTATVADVLDVLGLPDQGLAPGHPSRFFSASSIGVIRSMGTGNTMVEVLSPAMLLKVCR
jgi:hypothetical protein